MLCCAVQTIENQNKALMSEAKVAHKVKLQQLAIKNEERLAEVQKEHEVCVCAYLLWVGGWVGAFTVVRDCT